MSDKDTPYPFEQQLCYHSCMEKFRYKVLATVEIEAWNENDAWEALQDTIGIGDMNGITVIDCEYAELGPPRK